jgi:Icc protein
MINRRQALARMGSFMAAGWLGSKATLSSAETTSTAATGAAAPAAGEPLTIAHITDVHLIDKYDSEKWVAKALHMIQSHPSKPKLILNTGDCVMDTLRQKKGLSVRYWDLWNKTFQNENSLPVYTCLGNHDIWGGRLALDTPYQKDPQFGKKLALDKLSMKKPYYSFDFGGWHFIMLDSIYPIKTERDFAWIAKLDTEQLAWLKKDIAATPPDRNIVISSHMPILQVASMWGKKLEEDLSYKMSANSMMTDASELISFFADRSNVKLCFSGHVHRLDRIQLNHTTYICDGALSGGKWRGQNKLHPNGFSITTLNPDGTFDYKYENLGWKPSDRKA